VYPPLTAPGWEASETWAFDLRARHFGERADTDPQEEFLRWQGSQKAAVLLAVLHLLATRLEGPGDAWELRRWLGRGEELDVSGLITRVADHMVELTAMTGPDDPDVVLLSSIWQTIARAEISSGALYVRPGIIVAAAHARWLLDAQLTAERGGLAPHTPVSLLTEPGRSTLATVHTAYWMDDDGPPVGYVLKLADHCIVSVRAEMVGTPASSAAAGSATARSAPAGRSLLVLRLVARVLGWLPVDGRWPR